MLITSKGAKERNWLNYVNLENMEIFDQVENNPSIETAETIINKYRDHDISSIVGLGDLPKQTTPTPASELVCKVSEPGLSWSRPSPFVAEDRTHWPGDHAIDIRELKIKLGVLVPNYLPAVV